MKFLCERDELSEAVIGAGRALGSRGTSGVRLELSSNTCTVIGNGPEMSISASISVSNVEDGVAFVPPSLFGDLLRSMPEGAVEIATDDTTIQMRAGRTEFSLQLLNDIDTPRLRQHLSDPVVLNDKEFTSALRQVTRAASKDDSRDLLYTGVLFTKTESGIRLVCTDGIRLALRDIEGADFLPTDDDTEVIVPARALTELERLTHNLKPGHSDLAISMGAKEAAFQFGNWSLTTRLIDGRFRDYRQLLQPSYPRVLIADKSSLLESIRRLRRMAREARDIGTHLKFELSDTTLKLSVRIPLVGQAEDEIDVTFSGDEFVVAFDPELLAEGVEAVESEFVRVEFTENNRPACISNADNREYQYLLMPVKFR
ncbi:DNA polymerase-3 subunit beta [Ferrithrix thermotolerans DSM 19514]|uniref:Beta sliding clamp n=1 Tax=Ferrithrix thermotolerans DSM 19514 TaxID=1121881 RepID=A0A1M4XUC5_9ACTN|nr:DNA polymerase III subunit beta [Ferrithrix thermotolerans]SHE96873.1 DNA polymerase-3 subunit beta [Ferrithrix thermotolerans DSM 19514]